MWNQGISKNDARKQINIISRDFRDVTTRIDLQPGDSLSEILMTAEAFATEMGVVVLDKSYRALNQTFVPFHTHLGHPETFRGMARYAPTPHDIRAHQKLMKTHKTTHQTGTNLPGAIFHATGHLTLFWPGTRESQPIKVEVISPVNQVETSTTYLWSLKNAEHSGQLSLIPDGSTEFSPCLKHHHNLKQSLYHADLWIIRRKKIVMGELF